MPSPFTQKPVLWTVCINTFSLHLNLHCGKNEDLEIEKQRNNDMNENASKCHIWGNFELNVRPLNMHQMTWYFTYIFLGINLTTEKKVGLIGIPRGNWDTLINVIIFIGKIVKTGNQYNYISFYLDGWTDVWTDKSLKPVFNEHTLFITHTILPMQCALAPLTWCTLYIVKKKKRRWIESSITLAHPVFKQTHENICVINKGNHGTHCNCYFKVLFNLFFIIVIIS